MDINKIAFMKKALLIVAASFLVYNIYQSIISTVFISHFQSIVIQLPHFIKSSQPSLQLTLFLLQELSGAVGSYLSLIGAIFAFYSTILFFKKDVKYLEKLRIALLFESLYFLLLIPAATNHIVGSIVSSSAFLNVYAGVSFLLQAILIFPPLFMLSRKLREPQALPSILNWAGTAASLYVFGLWAKYGLMWVYALSSLGTQQSSLMYTVGSVNSLLTLLIAVIVSTVAWLTFRQKKKISGWLVGTAIILVGVYLIIYVLVSVWVPIYLAFLPLTDFWMIPLPILGIAILFGANNQK
jgi:hypothetical protein